MEMKEQTKWESYGDMIKRMEKNAKRRQTRDLRKKLQDPATTPEEGERLLEGAYREIPVLYAEPEDYFPKAIRKKYKLGEYAEEDKNKKEKYITSCGGIQSSIYPPLSDKDEKEEK